MSNTLIVVAIVVVVLIICLVAIIEVRRKLRDFRQDRERIRRRADALHARIETGELLHGHRMADKGARHHVR